MSPTKKYHEEKFNNLNGNIRVTWKFVNNIIQENTRHSKLSSKTEKVSETNKKH